MENEKKKTGYQSTWQDQLRDTASKIINREKFTYDLNGDALYKQYKDRYIQQGKQAMMDTMGQAATLTGGYGNSYAQTVGQQTYQGYLQGLNDQVPALYQLALDKYNSEGNQLKDNMALMMQQDDIDYGRYRDDLADRDNAFSKLMALMTGYGYQPTAEEMAAAGMTDAQMRAILGIKDSVGGSGGTGGDGNKRAIGVYGELLNYFDHVMVHGDKDGNMYTKSMVRDRIRESVEAGEINQNQAQALERRYLPMATDYNTEEKDKTKA